MEEIELKPLVVTLEEVKWQMLARESVSQERMEALGRETDLNRPAASPARIGLIQALSHNDQKAGSAAADSEHGPGPVGFGAASRVQDLQSQDMASKQLLRSHRRIQRQLRLLFIYPVAYFLSWIIPFVYHCLQYSDYFAQHPPFILACVVSVILSLQCALDCLVFCSREMVGLLHPSQRRGSCAASSG